MERLAYLKLVPLAPALASAINVPLRLRSLCDSAGPSSMAELNRKKIMRWHKVSTKGTCPNARTGERCCVPSSATCFSPPPSLCRSRRRSDQPQDVCVRRGRVFEQGSDDAFIRARQVSLTDEIRFMLTSAVPPAQPPLSDCRRADSRCWFEVKISGQTPSPRACKSSPALRQAASHK